MMNPPGPHELRYLVFAASDDGAEQGSWEAMASVQPSDLSAVMAEIDLVMASAEREAPGPRGPQEDGGVWDAHFQQHSESDGWITVTLTLTGPWAWGQALVAEFSDGS